MSLGGGAGVRVDRSCVLQHKSHDHSYLGDITVYRTILSVPQMSLTFGDHQFCVTETNIGQPGRHLMSSLHCYIDAASVTGQCTRL